MGRAGNIEGIMRWLYLVCLKCKHVKFMSEKPPALSLCFKLGIYTYFSLPSIWTSLRPQVKPAWKKKKKYSGATFYSMTSCLLWFSLWSCISDVKIISSSPFSAFFFPPPQQSHTDCVPLFLQLNCCAGHTKLLTWHWENTSSKKSLL